MGAEEIQALSGALKVNTALTTLDLRGVQQQQGGAKNKNTTTATTNQVTRWEMKEYVH